MAEFHQLLHWLESINLSTYYTNFVKHGHVSREHCECLDEQTLVNIGVHVVGHRRQILAHLPSARNEMWMDDESSLPNLPPKTKSMKNSYLYKDINLFNFTPCAGISAINLSSSGQNSNDELSKPKPVPRPRLTKVSKSLAIGVAPQSKPDVRPIPAPRHANSSEPCQNIAESLSTSLAQSSCAENSQSPSAVDDVYSFSSSNDFICAKGTNHNMLDKSDESANLNIFGQPSVIILPDACCQESSTDDPGQCLYSLPNKKTTKDSHVQQFYVNEAEFADIQTDYCSGFGSKYSQNSKFLIQCNKPCDINDTSHVDDDLYMNWDDLKNFKQDVVMLKVENRPSPALKNKKDCTLKTYPLIEEAEYANINDEVGESSLSITDNDGELYEPIWAADEHISNSCNLRSSHKELIPITIIDDDEYFNVDREKGLKTPDKQSLISKRKTTSFDLSPSNFAAPPLPEFTLTNDILNMFDPLEKPRVLDLVKCPVIPPRPTSYALPKLNNANLDFKKSLLISQQTHEWYGTNISTTTANDLFRDIDPFDEFSSAVYEFEKDSTQKSLSKLKNPSKISPLVSPYMAASDTDNIYAYAEEPDQTIFGSFGSNNGCLQKLPKSESSEAMINGSKCNVVSPSLPKWNPDFQPRNLQDTDSDSDGSLEDIMNNDNKTDRTEDDDTTENMTQVEILSPTSLQRRKEKSGYIYKQGGVKQNKRWDKQWVVFDGNTLRYYKTAEDQVSKRIIPVSCMENVEIGVKPINSKKFKFKLQCTNRALLFATDNLDEFKVWSSILMEAILNHKSNDGDVPGGDMANPDVSGWIKFNKNKYKYFVALKKHKMSYYQNEEDFKLACPIHEIDMKLAVVKEEVNKTKLQLATHYCTFILNFESSSDASSWKMAIEEAITDALGDNTVLDQVTLNPANSRCADCDVADSHWASMNLGIVLCVQCAGIHRGLDNRFSKVRSLCMGTKVWNSSLIEMFQEIGNDNANSFWLKYITRCDKINEHTPNEERKKHIQEKYLDKKFYNKHPLAEYKQRLNEALLNAAQTDNVMLTYQIVFTGANVLYHPEGKPYETAYELAKLAQKRIQVEFLLQNGGGKTTNFTENEEELVAKLRAEVQLQGYLLKTGPNQKDFLRRWCVLKNGYFSYYASEESKVEKNRIDNDCMLCIQTVHTDDKHPFCFEISSKKNSRHYLFCSQTKEDMLQWIWAIARVFCSVDFMDKITSMDFCLAGYVYLKMGFQNKEWHRTWFMLVNRMLIFSDIENVQRMEETDRKHDSVDLRKVISITKIGKGMEACERSLEPSYVFVLKAGERLLYFQCDLSQDTERMFIAVESAVKRGGDSLDDQVLTSDDIPVIIEKCVTYTQYYGLKLQGVYRLGETDSKIKALLDRFREDARSVVLKEEEHTVHLVCNVLKRFFRNLKDPLFTTQLYKGWIQAASKSDHKKKLQQHKYLLKQLPHINFLTLRYLANHLYKLSQHSKENLMTLDNIAIAFGPTLMKCANSENLNMGMAAIGDFMQLEIDVVSDIVKYHEWLFDFEEGLSRETSLVKRIAAAERRFIEITTKQQNNEELMLYVYFEDPRGSYESVKINRSTTVLDVIRTLQRRSITDSWCLYEIVNSNLVRPLHNSMKVLPIVLEWQNWSDYYRKNACLCYKQRNLRDEIEGAYDPHKALFADMKYAKKGKFKKMTFKFSQAKLLMYKDLKNVTNPAGSWNIEDLIIYKGCDPKRSPNAKFSFTFLIKGEKVGDQDHPYFGRAICCATKSDQLAWLAAMLVAQK